ncbi:MAG: hypothetical protein JSW72_00745 [Candidatus Bathyarchaeota archaeon]|nr:MAG: hypothetical protein JSW72_00745 [Candidatus Bathyarchaeota archaeon]
MREIKRLIVLLALALTLLFAAVPVQAKEPLKGSMELYFMVGGPDIGYGPPIWSGTISGDINGEMYFYNVGTGKQGNQAPGKTIHFGEVWYIITVDGVLLGTDEGVVSLDGSEYRMNGVVTQATGDWVYLEGRNVHMSGYITWAAPGVPETAPGTFRIN